MLGERHAELESGRLVLVPKRRPARGPMAQACAAVAVPAGRLYVLPWYVAVAGHPGTAGLRRITVSSRLPEGRRDYHVILAHAPLLIVADHSFVYPRCPGPMSESGRALRACAGSTRRSGTYRTDSFDVGVALRTGWRRGALMLSACEGGFACELEPEPESQEQAATWG